MKLKGLLLAVGAFLVIALAPGLASAEYVCSVTFRPWSSTSGPEGSVSFGTYTGPDCTGDFYGNFYLCSSGATSSVCAQSTSYRYDRQALFYMHRALEDALINNTYIHVAQTTCYGGFGTNCLGYFSLYSDQ